MTCEAEPMRVGYLLNSFPNLSETFITNELKELLRLGVDVRIIALRNTRHALRHAHADELTERVVFVPESGGARWRKLVLHVRYAVRRPRGYAEAWQRAEATGSDTTRWHFRNSVFFARQLERWQVDRIHAHYATEACDIARAAAQLTGRPYSFTTHGYDIFCEPPPDLAPRAAVATHVICVSCYNKHYLHEEFGIPLDKLHVIHCGIDPTYFAPGTATQQVYPPRIVTVARLHPVKGLKHLIAACGHLRDDGVAFECVIVGDGPLRSELEQQITDGHLQGHIRLVGGKAADDVRELYHSATVACLPSESESMGLANMEALACEVPVVATRVRGVSELVEDGVSGRLIEPGNPAMLAEALAEVLAMSPQQRRDWGRAGRRKVLAEFTVEQQARQLLALWSQP